jgi:ArsR family transcriptional regulator, virulence genes transcriptional regulator
MNTAISQLERAAEAASVLLKALSSPHRLMIVCRLIDGEQTVGALAGALGARESVISQHLAVLRRERIVSARRDGQSMHYSVASHAARAVVDALAKTICGPHAEHGIAADQI